jgi:UDP-N-acetylmuramate dehydrogenase
MPDLIADYPLRAHNTFGFDVRARYACRLDTPADARFALADPRVATLPRLMLGGGSNVVFTGDFDGLVFLVALRGKRIVAETTDARYVEAAAGENWHDFVAWTLAQACFGLENLALIPGTVGAAPIQNIGAYGLEAGEQIERVHAVDLETGTPRVFDRAACAFDYRDSLFKRAEGARWLITSVVFRLPRVWRARVGYADVARELDERGIRAPAPRDVFDAVCAIRRAKLPDPGVTGNAGSFFKNPVVDAALFAGLREREPDIAHYVQADGRVKLAAAWLIDRCGWRGKSMGAAGVHERQALVLVNRGGATGAQVLDLAREIAGDVLSRFGVLLEPEPVVV